MVILCDAISRAKICLQSQNWITTLNKPLVQYTFFKIRFTLNYTLHVKEVQKYMYEFYHRLKYDCKLKKSTVWKYFILKLFTGWWTN